MGNIKLWNFKLNCKRIGTMPYRMPSTNETRSRAAVLQKRMMKRLSTHVAAIYQVGGLNFRCFIQACYYCAGICVLHYLGCLVYYAFQGENASGNHTFLDLAIWGACLPMIHSSFYLEKFGLLLWHKNKKKQQKTREKEENVCFWIPCLCDSFWGTTCLRDYSFVCFLFCLTCWYGSCSYGPL